MSAPMFSGSDGPVTETEVIRALWVDLLGTSELPLDVNFFELGGHSLAILQLAARLQEAFGLIVPIADLFDNLTINAQVRLVERLFEQRLAELTD
jgi:acyl carrier protein